MKLYADLPHVRTRQIAADAAAALGVVLSIAFGVMLYGLVAAAAAPGAALVSAGDAVSSLPGGGTPGGALADAGATMQDAVLGLSFWLGTGSALLGIGVVALLHLPWRLSWIRDATAAEQLRDTSEDLRVLAHRAVASRPLPRILDEVPDPGAALAAGDYDRLARVELEELGLRAPR